MFSRRFSTNLITVFCAAWLLPSLCFGGGPALRVMSEHTHTRDVRDIALVKETVWVATGGGIAVHRRSDGAFLYKLTGGNGLPGNSVYALLVEDDSVRIGGAFGLAEIRIDAEGRGAEIDKVLFGDPAIFDPVFALIKTSSGVKRLGFRTGLAMLDETGAGGGTLGATRNGMWRAAAVNRTALAMGALDGRLVIRFDDRGRRPDIFHLDAPIMDVAPLETGFLIATGGDLVLYENGRVRSLRLFRNRDQFEVAATVLTSTRGKVLVGTASGDLFAYESGRLRSLGGIGQRITALTQDGEKLWLGTARQGLMRFDIRTGVLSAPLRPKDEICSNHITHMTRHRGGLVAGSFDEGACRLGEHGWQLLTEQRSPYVHGLASDGERLWMGTSSGLARYDADFLPDPITESDPTVLRWYADTAVTAAVEAGAGRVMLGSPWGAVLIQRKQDRVDVRFVSKKAGVPRHLTQVAALGDTLFFSSETAGVRTLGANNESVEYLDPVHLPEAWVIDVIPGGKSGFWAATCQRGIAFVDGERGLMIDETKGLADNRTIALARFGDSAFVATLGGLSYVAETGKVSPVADRFTADPRGAALYVDGKTLWLGTESGLVQYAIE